MRGAGVSVLSVAIALGACSWAALQSLRNSRSKANLTVAENNLPAMEARVAALRREVQIPAQPIGETAGRVFVPARLETTAALHDLEKFCHTANIQAAALAPKSRSKGSENLFLSGQCTLQQLCSLLAQVEHSRRLLLVDKMLVTKESNATLHFELEIANCSQEGAEAR